MLINVCPVCGSGRLSGLKKIIAGSDVNEVTCLDCGWKGPQSETYVSEYKEQGLEPDVRNEVVRKVVDDFIDLMMVHLPTGIAVSILRSGLLPPKGHDQLLLEVVRAATVGACEGALTHLQKRDAENAARAGLIRFDEKEGSDGGSEDN